MKGLMYVGVTEIAMSEEDIIQKVEFFIRNSAINKMDSDFYKNGGWEVIDLEISKAIKGLLELYKNLKEIEKSHQEENGKLRVYLTKQDKMIELLIEDLQGEGCLNMSREEIDNYYERRMKLAEEAE